MRRNRRLLAALGIGVLLYACAPTDPDKPIESPTGQPDHYFSITPAEIEQINSCVSLKDWEEAAAYYSENVSTAAAADNAIKIYDAAVGRQEELNCEGK